VSDIVAFIEGALYHTKGRFAGQPFRLTDWQRQQIIAPLFGTLLPDGRRQYRTAFVEIPRKNGKTQLAAALALYLLFADGEAGAEVYSAAADKDQARLVFGEAARMRRAPSCSRLSIRTSTATRSSIPSWAASTACCRRMPRRNTV
jgi:phage terminase large subunit-like protein